MAKFVNQIACKVTSSQKIGVVAPKTLSLTTVAEANRRTRYALAFVVSLDPADTQVLKIGLPLLRRAHSS